MREVSHTLDFLYNICFRIGKTCCVRWGILIDILSICQSLVFRYLLHCRGELSFQRGKSQAVLHLCSPHRNTPPALGKQFHETRVSEYSVTPPFPADHFCLTATQVTYHRFHLVGYAIHLTMAAALALPDFATFERVSTQAKTTAADLGVEPRNFLKD